MIFRLFLQQLKGIKSPILQLQCLKCHLFSNQWQLLKDFSPSLNSTYFSFTSHLFLGLFVTLLLSEKGNMLCVVINRLNWLIEISCRQGSGILIVLELVSREWPSEGKPVIWARGLEHCLYDLFQSHLTVLRAVSLAVWNIQ